MSFKKIVIYGSACLGAFSWGAYKGYNQSFSGWDLPISLGIPIASGIAAARISDKSEGSERFSDNALRGLEIMFSTGSNLLELCMVGGGAAVSEIIGYGVGSLGHYLSNNYEIVPK